MSVRKSERQKTKMGIVKKSCLGHNQSNRECGAGQQGTPSVDLKFAVERSQNHIEVATAGTENPRCQTVAESDPQELSMLQEGQRARLARHPKKKLLLMLLLVLLLMLLLLCEGHAV